MKLSEDQIKAKVQSSKFIQPQGTSITLCLLHMENGYVVTGQSSCVDPDEFDAELGKKLAYLYAINKAFELEGYLLSEQRFKAGK